MRARAIQGATLVVLAVVLAACGGQSPSDEQTAGSEQTAGDGHTHGDSAAGGTGMDMGGMNMGDPNAVPAAQVPGAELVSGQFQLLDTAPEGYQNVAGTATLARHSGGTTVTVDFSGLKPNTEFISHVHQGSCAESGGPHYKFDPAGGDMPPNEIHMAFTSTAEGTGSITANNTQTAGPEAKSVVVHPRKLPGEPKVACAPLS